MKTYILLIFVLITGCARRAPEGDQTAAIQEATFRFQFEKNASVQQQRTGVYFLAFGDAYAFEAKLMSDPSDEFIARFAGQKPRVAKYSDAGRTDSAWVIDRKTQEPGIIFYIHDVKITGPTSAEVLGGYLEHSRSGSANVYQLKYGSRGWYVANSWMTGISQNRPNQPLEHNAYARHASCVAAVAPSTGVAHL